MREYATLGFEMKPLWGKFERLIDYAEKPSLQRTFPISVLNLCTISFFGGVEISGESHL